MPELPIRAHWDKVVAELEAKLEKAKAVRDALGDPELADEIVKSLGCHSPSPQRRKRTSKKRTHVDTLLQFFLDRDADWATIAEITEGTTLNRDAVRQVVYKSGAKCLERRTSPGRSRHTQFRPKSG